MFSQTVEYALRAMVHLADRGEACTTPQIAEVTMVPASYLAKVLQSLNKAGLVKSQRGLHGGFALARPADSISILDIVNCVDPIRRITTCPLGLASHRTTLCPLHKRLDTALAHVENAFGSCSLADLLAEPTTSKPLCPVPVPIMVEAPTTRSQR